MTATWAAERRPQIDPWQQLLIFLLGAGGTGGFITIWVKGRIDREQKVLDNQKVLELQNMETKQALELQRVEQERLRELARDERLQKEVDRWTSALTDRVGKLEGKVEVLEEKLQAALSREANLQIQLAREVAKSAAETERANQAVMAKVEQDARITYLEAELAHQRHVVRILAVQLATARGGVDPDVLLEELAGHNRRSGDAGGQPNPGGN